MVMKNIRAVGFVIVGAIVASGFAAPSLAGGSTTIATIGAGHNFDGTAYIVDEEARTVTADDNEREKRRTEIFEAVVEEHARIQEEMVESQIELTQLAIALRTLEAVGDLAEEGLKVKTEGFSLSSLADAALEFGKDIGEIYGEVKTLENLKSQIDN